MLPHPKLKKVRRACEMLERVIEINPENWNAMWVLGMAWKAIKAKQFAYDAFRRAFEIEKQNPNVARELAGICIELGKGEEAVRVAHHAMRLAPEDAGLVANYAMALLINGQLDAAIGEVDRSLKMNPADLITQRLKGLMTAIQQHDMSLPSKWPPD